MAKDNEQIQISPYSKLKVEWSDRPENYSKEAKNKIKNHFAKKYGVNKNNISVIYRPVKFLSNGDTIEVTGANIENIMDISYQRELMKEWIKRENKVVDFNRIIALDDKINAELNLENNSLHHNSWAIKWISINNFLSFGEDNLVNFNKLKGLTVVNSIPSNQGGKTTLTIDALKFLLHGNTTKTDKNEEIFNTYTDKNELLVKGMIEIDNEEIIIERKMKRTAKKGGGWTISNKVNYYKILPDGEEEEQNDENAIKTTAKLRSSIGNEKDFEMLVLATEKNLDDLIGLTTTESGKILTRLIGLEVVEIKEGIVRKMYNEFDKKKKSNDFDIITLMSDITDLTDKIDMGQGIQKDLTQKLSDIKTEINNYQVENDRLLNSKITIDVVISSINPSKLEEEIAEITTKGKGHSAKIVELTEKISEIGEIEFDEDLHHSLTKENNNLFISIGTKKSEVIRLTQTIEDLISSGICKACNQKLDNVDNSEHVESHSKAIELLKVEIAKLETKNKSIIEELSELNKTKQSIDIKNRLELDKDRLEVEIGSLRNKIISKKNDLKKYKLNEEAIEFNRIADSEVSNVKTKLSVCNYSKDGVVSNIEKITQDIKNNQQNIETKTNLISAIKKEEEIEKIYKLYIELVGKKGISKLVLRSILPVINSEIQRLLDDVCDFDIEISIDDKNDVQFLIVKDEIPKLLKSGSGFEKTAASLALRGVLGKISTLPMPNFITFDEVMGKVANENIEKLKPLFDKIKQMYDIVFLITHNDVVKDWSTSIVTVVKEDNVSSIKFS